MRYSIRNKVKTLVNIHRNKRLCRQFPFLVPWNRFSGKLITDCAGGEKGYWPGSPDEIPLYDYSYTELDNLPTGWMKAFGIPMCVEIRDALIEDGDLERWRIVQMKEKYGALALYDNGHKHGSRIPNIIRKYEALSTRTCIMCGKPATKVTCWWISPYCDKCCPKERAVPIEEYYDGVEEFI